jgi:hypothetical protein
MNNSEKSSLGRFCFKGTGRKFIRKLVGEFVDLTVSEICLFV